jgi:hypothetical protein
MKCCVTCKNQFASVGFNSALEIDKLQFGSKKLHSDSRFTCKLSRCPFPKIFQRKEKTRNALYDDE